MKMPEMNIPSPLSDVSHFFDSSGEVSVYLKRDDLIHPLISGNKWRKLLGFIELAATNKIERIQTYGGAFSNHLLATACAAASLGLKSKAIVRGTYADTNNPVLKLCRIFGMELILTDKEQYKAQSVLESRIDRGTLIIPEGGAGVEALVGIKKGFDELPFLADHIFCAVGTGTTLAGWIKAIHDRNLKTRAHGVLVLKGEGDIRQKISALSGYSSFDLHTDFHLGGYAKVKTELTRFISQFASETGILTDPVYTGKLLYGLKSLIENGRFKSGEKIIAIHSGGLTGMMNPYMLQHF